MMTRFTTRRCLLLAAALLGLLGAAPRATAGDKVKVTLVAILASTQDNTVDPRLQGIAAEVQKKEKFLTGFRIASMACKSLTPEEKHTFNLVEKQQAEVVVEHGADKDNRVTVRVRAPLQGEIVYNTVCGKFLPIVTRYKTKKGEWLILALRATPCHKK